MPLDITVEKKLASAQVKAFKDLAPDRDDISSLRKAVVEFTKLSLDNSKTLIEHAVNFNHKEILQAVAAVADDKGNNALHRAAILDPELYEKLLATKFFDEEFLQKKNLEGKTASQLAPELVYEIDESDTEEMDPELNRMMQEDIDNFEQEQRDLEDDSGVESGGKISPIQEEISAQGEEITAPIISFTQGRTEAEMQFDLGEDIDNAITFLKDEDWKEYSKDKRSDHALMKALSDIPIENYEGEKASELLKLVRENGLKECEKFLLEQGVKDLTTESENVITLENEPAASEDSSEKEWNERFGSKTEDDTLDSSVDAKDDFDITIFSKGKAVMRNGKPIENATETEERKPNSTTQKRGAWQIFSSFFSSFFSK